MASFPIYQFHIELDDYKPKMWRRFNVISNIAMVDLGYIIMSLYEMEGRHLFNFQVPMLDNFKTLVGSHINSPENREAVAILEQNGGVVDIEFIDNDYIPRAGSLTLNILEIPLSKVLSGPKEKLFFNYDFGDNWSFTLTLEDVVINNNASENQFPMLLNGEGYGIIEDCGGVDMLTDLAQSFKEKGDDYEEYCNLLGVDELNLDEFDKERATYKLSRFPNYFKTAYEPDEGFYEEEDDDAPDFSIVSPQEVWDRISPDIKKMIENSAFCPDCTITSIVDYKVTVHDDYDLLLTGKCAKCGKDITRLIDY